MPSNLPLLPPQPPPPPLPLPSPPPPSAPPLLASTNTRLPPNLHPTTAPCSHRLHHRHHLDRHWRLRSIADNSDTRPHNELRCFFSCRSSNTHGATVQVDSRCSGTRRCREEKPSQELLLTECAVKAVAPRLTQGCRSAANTPSNGDAAISEGHRTAETRHGAWNGRRASGGKYSAVLPHMVASRGGVRT